MSRKFKVGERVKVARALGDMAGCAKPYVGRVGTVSAYSEDTEWPYELRGLRGSFIESCFSARELEHAPKSKKAKKKGK